MNILKIGEVYKLQVSSKQEYNFILIDKIICVVAQENYSFLHLVDGTELLVTYTLKSIEERLRIFGFVRCHRSYLVNVACIDKWIFKGKNVIVLSNDLEVEVSRKGVKRIKELIHSCN